LLWLLLRIDYIYSVGGEFVAKKSIVLIPQYLNQLNCIGSRCEDNCCYGWKVIIDKKTYEKYRKVTDQELKPLLDKNVKRNRSNPTEVNYAKINLNEQERCPFLNDNKLCNIHNKLGSQYLSKVCTSYPRVTNLLDGTYERAATMSCPEIVRISLLNKEQMEFDEIEEDDKSQNIIKYILETKGINSIGKLSRYLWELRIFSISLIQNRNYRLWERLIILGLFMKKVSEYSDDKVLDKIPQLIEQYNQTIASNALSLELDKIPTNLCIQMELMKEISDQRFALNFSKINAVYVKCVTEFLYGINYLKNDKIENITERYRDAHDHYYKPFMDEHEYILENYVVNYIFKELFPVSNKLDAFQSYVKLILNYSYIKMLLIGVAGHHKKLDEDMIVRVIYSFSRAVEHNTEFLDRIFNIINSNGFATMPYMSILIKN
jgi:lysine-N-methylase